MLRRNPSGHRPQVHESAYVDQTAILCGKIIVHENVFIGPYVVIRADEVDETGDMEPIIIGAHSNIQDGVVIHSKSGAAVNIGERTSIAHRAIVHGPAPSGTTFSSVSTAYCSTAPSATVAWCATTPWSTVAICHPGFMFLRPSVSVPQPTLTRFHGYRHRHPNFRKMSPVPTMSWSRDTRSCRTNSEQAGVAGIDVLLTVPACRHC